ncbi:uncharacterized protein LOC129956683 [Argiope bruennichi]|uniref:Ras-related protein RAB1BV like protein n=1 Tax=Argiope bruennichi TaxID=94029 RepID=A0A8T0FE19_ARGBR|nr:uncharacterized protein LOC129956683 [Argiope bruennichi]KAF8789534.1 Ras-related protein RAB1BV like protein [Argiope bruennichi]
MAFDERLDVLQDSSNFYKFQKVELQKCLTSESKVSTTKFYKKQESSPEPLHIFVLGPSICGKRRIIEYAANRHLDIPFEKNIHFAYKLSGFLLKGIEAEINLWHVGNIERSLGILQTFYQKCKTCFMLIYDVNDSSTFDDARQWIPSLRCVLDDYVPIILVGYEDSKDPSTCKTSPVSFSDGMKAKTFFELRTFYEFSDLTGPAVCEMFFDAAHIALENENTIEEVEVDESEEN